MSSLLNSFICSTFYPIAQDESVQLICHLAHLHLECTVDMKTLNIKFQIEKNGLRRIVEPNMNTDLNVSQDITVI